MLERRGCGFDLKIVGRQLVEAFADDKSSNRKDWMQSNKRELG